MSKKPENDPVLIGKVRKDYYNTSDGIYALNAYKEQLSPETQEALTALHQAFESFSKALTKEHPKWD